MLIDRFSPHYDVRAQYRIEIKAPVERVYQTARFMDMKDSKIVRWLYRLRGLPGDNLSFDGMLKWGFVLLADIPMEEIVFGLIGRFWTRSAQVQSLDADAFVRFDRPGFAKALGNMAFFLQDNGSVLVTTETRVHCFDQASRRSFRRYWLLVGPFSGLIRKEWLRLIKRQAERLPSYG